MAPPVAITGISVISPWGEDWDSFRDGYLEQQMVLEEHPELVDLPTGPLAGVSTSRAFRAYLKRRKDAKLMTSAARLALGAAGNLLGQPQHSGIVRSSLGLQVSVGREPPDDGAAEQSLVRSIDSTGHFSERLLAEEGRRAYPPLLPLRTLPNMVLAHISIQLGIGGDNGTWTGLQSLMAGYWSIIEHRCESVIVGGADSLVSLAQARDQLRQGIETRPSEAAVMCMLRRAEHATEDCILISPVKSIGSTTVIKQRLQRCLGDAGAAQPWLGFLAAIAAQDDTYAGWHIQQK